MHKKKKMLLAVQFIKKNDLILIQSSPLAYLLRIRNSERNLLLARGIKHACRMQVLKLLF